VSDACRLVYIRRRCGVSGDEAWSRHARQHVWLDELSRGREDGRPEPSRAGLSCSGVWYGIGSTMGGAIHGLFLHVDP
jgi:hypothetical protein